MAEKFLDAIDQSFAQALARRGARRVARGGDGDAAASAPVVEHDALEPPALAYDETERARRTERFLLIFLALQLLSEALLFAPGAQPFRSAIRVLPYLSALAPLGYYMTRHDGGRRPVGTSLMVGAMLLLGLNLLHPTTQMAAGLAQCVFQLSIAAPLFWMSKAIRSTRQFERLLTLLFLMNFVGAALGILQVYWPDRFMPPQFSQVLDEDYLSMLSYVGSSGQLITRPPGLSDIPGGAAFAGGFTALLGLWLSLRTRKAWQTAGYLGAAAVGLAVVYLTQVRSVLLMIIGAAAVLTIVLFRRGRTAHASWVLAVGSALVVASFLWASSVGGSVLDQRFLDIGNRGALTTYRTDRGGFLANTLGDLLNEYPLGAGVGRWGMMNTAFGDPASYNSQPLHVEIQLTGWLLDGGLPMWLLYGGAILASLLAAFRLSDSPDQNIGDMSVIVLALEVFLAGMAMSGPTFNTQMGIMFWVLAAGLQGAAVHLVNHEH